MGFGRTKKTGSRRIDGDIAFPHTLNNTWLEVHFVVRVTETGKAVDICCLFPLGIHMYTKALLVL